MRISMQSCFGDVDVIVNCFNQCVERVVILLGSNESRYDYFHLASVKVFSKLVQNVSLYRLLRVVVVRIPT